MLSCASSDLDVVVALVVVVAVVVVALVVVAAVVVVGCTSASVILIFILPRSKFNH